MNQSHQPLARAWQSVLQRGLEHLRDGEFDEARLCFERAHRLSPDQPEVCYALGRDLMRRGDHERAETLLSAAWNGDPSLISAAGSLARCMGVYQGRAHEAHAVLDHAEARRGPHPVLRVVRSELFLEQERFDRAREDAEAVLADADTPALQTAARAVLARVENHAGVTCAESGELERAAFLFRRAAHLDPAWSGPHINLGATLVRLGKPRRARAAYERAVALEPDSDWMQLDYGLLLRDLGDLAGARQALERALAHAPAASPAATDVIIALAGVHIDAGASGEAIALVADALDAAPHDSDLWTQLGVALAAAGALDDAEASWRRALDLAPGHVEACRRLADLLARQSRFGEATILAELALAREADRLRDSRGGPHGRIRDNE